MGDRQRLLGAIALALLVRLVVVAAGGGPGGVEVFEYDDIARNLLAGRGYVHHHLGTDYRVFYSGVSYVLLLAGGYAVTGGSVLAALVVQAAASAGLTATAFMIGRRLGGEGTACLAAALVALHPGLAFYDTHKVHPLSFDALAIAVAALMLLRLRETLETRTAVLAGLAFGLALLQRGTMIVAPAIGLVWLLAMEPRARARLIRLGGAYALGALLVMTPWVARNWFVVGTPILSSIGAESLWRGNVAHSGGGSYALSGQTVLDDAPGMREALHGRSELQQAEVFQAAALSDIAHSPGAFLGRIGRKLATFWAFGPVSGLLYPVAYLYVYAAYYAAAMALAAVGACQLVGGRHRRADAFATFALVVGLGLGVSLVQSVFYVELRHRWGVEPLVLALTAVGLARVWTAVRGSAPVMVDAPR